MMKIQEDIQIVEQWTKSNQLVLDLTKTRSLLFGTAQKLAGATDFKILIQGKGINWVSKFCYLGVTLDENLSIFVIQFPILPSHYELKLYRPLLCR